jgi:RimJ/RimL family protein N-acetyltransferase
VSVTHDQLTERLILSRPDPVADLEASFAIFSDPALWTHAPQSRHTTPRQTHDWLLAVAAGWDRDGLGYWIVRLREGETTIGAGGVGRQSSGAWNIFYRLSRAHHGRGLATELARAGLARATALDPGVPAIAWIRPQNLASRRVAERLGLTNHGPRIDPSDGVVRLAYADRPLTDAYGASAADPGGTAEPGSPLG